ncbi:MAG: RNA polymerase sigma factor [Microgenomates group bacterium]
MQNPRFEYLYKKFMSPLTRFVFKKIGSNPELAEEVVSSTMVAAWKGYKAFRHKSSYFTWLCRIALNKIADYYRDQVHKNSRLVVPFIENLVLSDSQSLSPEEQMSLQDLRKSVNQCLDLLPYEKRRLLWFRYWLDMSYDQIANAMNISVRGVEGRLYRAKQDFAKIWSDTSK